MEIYTQLIVSQFNQIKQENDTKYNFIEDAQKRVYVNNFLTHTLTQTHHSLD